MSNREIIPVNGMPGSGIERLGKLLASDEHSGEAIDFNRLVLLGMEN